MDWVLSAILVFQMWLAGRKVRWAWSVAIANQVLWVGYALWLGQYGLIAGALAIGGMAVWNHVQWSRA